MTRALTSLAAAVALLVPATASAQLPGAPVTAKGVEFVKNIALHADSAGARLLGKHFYLTTERDLTIYDVSRPEDPRKLGSLDFPQPNSARNLYFSEEDPDTNGRILITSNEGAIEVIDVRDKSKPTFLSRLAGAKQHTISCVLDCTWAYGSDGSIVDLRDPSKPRLANNNWQAGKGVVSDHDVTEVAPGLILTASQPMLLLDARKDPADPTVIAKVGNADKRFNHATLWPHLGRDRFALVGGESVGPACSDAAAAAFQTYDTTGHADDGTFELVDEFRLAPGLIVDGRMADSTFCVHWFDPHPTYRDGGLVAIAWYEHGTRFLKISPQGEISEVGHYLPLGTSASAAYWVSERIAYITDYNRGLDIVRFTGPIGPGPSAPGR